MSARAARGAAWTLPTSLVSRAIGLAGTLLLAKYLTPFDYGTVMAALVVVTTATTVTTLGVGVFLVAARDLSREVVFHTTCWFLVTGILATGAVVVFSGAIGAWIGAPLLVRYVPVLALIVILERIIYIPERLLVRRLSLARLSIARAAGEILYTSVSVGLAAIGTGAVALVWGTFARTLLRLVMIVPSVERREWLEPYPINWRVLKEIIVYGVNVSGAAVANFAMRRWDNLLVSRYFGADVMGAYNYAYNLADTPAVAVGEQLSDVMAASFPQVPERNRAPAILRACRLMSLVMFPLAFGLGIVGPTIRRVFLNERWAMVGSLLLVLCTLSAARPIGDVIESYLYASARPRVVVALEWLSFVGVVTSIPLFRRGGVEWASAAVAFVFVCRAVVALWCAHRYEAIPVTVLFRPIWPPLVASAVMVIAVQVVRWRISVSPPIQLAVEIIIGATVYVGCALLVARSAVEDLVLLVRSLVRRGGELRAP